MEKKEKLEAQFHELVKAHKSTIYSVCYMFSSDPDEVNDLFQDSLINIWKGLGSYAGQSSLKTLLWRITLNTCISAGRKKKLKKVPLDMNVNLFEDRDAQSWQVKLLHDRIQRLQPFDRAIVLLWLENISYEEIGQIVGISTKNVSIRLFRIREQLKNMKEDE